MTKRRWKWLGPVGTILLSTIFGAAIGAFVTVYTGLLQHNRTVIETDFNGFKTTATEIFQLLDAFSVTARTGKQVDDQSQHRFQLTLLKLYDQADKIAQRAPQVRPEFSDLARTLIALQTAAEQTKSPLDAKPLVEATSNYLAAENKFSKKVSEVQRSLLAPLAD
jgi:hypothetical protein